MMIWSSSPTRSSLEDLASLNMWLPYVEVVLHPASHPPQRYQVAGRPVAALAAVVSPVVKETAGGGGSGGN